MSHGKFRRICALALAMVLLAGCAAAPAEETAEPSQATEPEMPMDLSGKYALSPSGEAIIDDVNMTHLEKVDDNNRVFYEIFVGSFSDSNGDGVGDLRGIINRLDYLNDGDPASGQSLGVEGIWLTPIFKSPSYHKYDVADYYAISGQFGTLEDLQELIDLCHERDVKIILDLVLNHTSTQNPMFQKFQEAHKLGDTQDPYYDYYCYYTAGETAPAGRTFAKLAGTADYYECNFSTAMPELNFDNEAVRQEVLNIAKFYLDMGVDGFRFDAAKYIYYGDHEKSGQFWEWFMEKLRGMKPDIYAVAEVWDSDGVTDFYFPALNCFNFTVAQAEGRIAQAAKGGNVNAYTAYVEDYIGNVRSLNLDAAMVPFVANHDTDRAAGYLMPDMGHMQMAANLYILGPGSPFIYYGEEIGLRGSRGGAQTDANRRLAMLWGDGDQVKDPEGTTYKASNQVSTTVVAELGNGAGLYNYYKRLLMIRSANPEIARGEYVALALKGKMGGFTATWSGSTVCVLHNTTKDAAAVELSELGNFDTISAVIGLGDATLSGTTLTVSGQTSVVLRLEGSK